MVDNFWAVAGQLSAAPGSLVGGGGGLLPPSQEPHPAVSLRKFGLHFWPFGLAANEKSLSCRCLLPPFF